ncbi:MAG: hypothetical protein ACK524_02950 [Planctomyces sp.]|jgi:hypothetical protein
MAFLNWLVPQRLRESRRWTVSMFAILCMTALGFVKEYNVTMEIAGLAAALAGSNAWQKRAEHKPEGGTNA